MAVAPAGQHLLVLHLYHNHTMKIVTVKDSEWEPKTAICHLFTLKKNNSPISQMCHLWCHDRFLALTYTGCDISCQTSVIHRDQQQFSVLQDSCSFTSLFFLPLCIFIYLQPSTLSPSLSVALYTSMQSVLASLPPPCTLFLFFLLFSLPHQFLLLVFLPPSSLYPSVYLKPIQCYTYWNFPSGF